MKRPSLPTPYSLLLITLLLAAVLRFYHLDAQSFWNDEGNSARIAERSLDLIVEGAAGDIHPPGYYVLLHYWRALFGQSEFALRSLSVACGLALVALTYLLGRRLFGKNVGLIAAFLGAISPFAVYYSQEARMYALLGALSVASIYLLFRCLQKPGFSVSKATKTWFLVYVLTDTIGLYTHYAFTFVLLVHNAIFGLWWLAAARRSESRWRWLLAWGGAQAAIIALYLPWLPIAFRSATGWSPAGTGYELGRALLNVLRILTVGITLPIEQATLALVGAGALLLAGLWPRKAERTDSGDYLHLTTETQRAQRKQKNILSQCPLCLCGEKKIAPNRLCILVGNHQTDWPGVASLALYLLLPVLFIFVFDLYKPAWLKFLIVALPPFHILIARGIENLIQGARGILHLASRILLLASCFLLLAPSLYNLYFDPAYARDDYRQIAADVAASARSGDAVILNAPNQWEVFTYYYPDQDVYPSPYHPDLVEADAFLTPLVERYQRLFVLYWGDAESDPQRLVETWLAHNAYKAGDRWYGRARLATYRLAPLPEEPSVVLDARFGDFIRLHGYALDDASLAPGDILPVTLFWETQSPIAERYKVTVQLLDGAGQLAAQVDTEPGDGMSPTDGWQPGQSLADRYGISLPSDLPPGRYTLVVALYHLASGERLPVTTGGELAGNHLSLGDVEVE